MLITRLLHAMRSSPGRSAPARESAPSDAVEALPGFNKLVRGRHGVFVANENDLYVGRALIDYGEYAEIEWRLLERYVQPSGVVLEIGANIGTHSVAIAKRLGPAGRLIAVEPQPFVFQTLCANLALNALQNVGALNCGCGSSTTPMSVDAIDYGAPRNFGGVALRPARPGESTSVAMTTLDTLLRDHTRADLVKIDVEGMEQDVLESGRQSIRRLKPVLYVENDRVAQSRALIETVWSLGYRAWWHVPPLYNPDNYFGNTRDAWPGVGSFNMLCLPDNREPEPGDDLHPVVDAAHHPLAVIGR